MRRPCCKKLAQFHGPECRMRSRQFQLLRTEIQVSEPVKVGAPQGRKFVEQVRERLAVAVSELRLPVDGIERTRRSVQQNRLNPDHPVCSFQVCEMPHY